MPKANDNSNNESYGLVAVCLHWATAILVAGAYLLSAGGPESRIYAAANDFERSLHETLGLAVFAVVLLRLIWRMFDKVPEPPPIPS